MSGPCTALAPDGTDFSGWIGRTIERTDVLTPRLVREYRATLHPHLASTAGVPPGIFWCLAPEALDKAQLGRDGHPRTGIVLPALPYPRRMWAGGELSFPASLSESMEVARTSIIESISFKSGQSGQLGFVAVRHLYRSAGQLLVDERQDIVYREDPAATSRPEGVAAGPQATRRPEPTGKTLLSWQVEADPVLLFRFSALTFNGHRIHYDQPYATAVEGYAGLVVHGPLQAALMLNAAAACLGRMPGRFAYRGLAPLICGQPFCVDVREGGGGALSARVVSAAGTTTMAATIEE